MKTFELERKGLNKGVEIRRRSEQEKRMLKQRFPRLKLTSEVRLGEKILHRTYNQIAISRHIKKRSGWQYDIYKTKNGKTALAKFLMLAQTLSQKGIDPAVYMKVMCRYGRWEYTRYLPHPTWLSGEKALEAYSWLYEKERRKWELDSDWKKALRGHEEEDIYKAVRSSASAVEEVRKQFKLSLEESVLMLERELGPWFMAAYLKANEVEKEPETRDFRLCARFLKDNPRVYRKVRSVLADAFS